MKRFLAILSAICLCLSMSTIAFATEKVTDVTESKSAEVWEVMPFGGVETWVKKTSFYNVGSFTMEGNNLTPVKTMGTAGTLSLRLDDIHPVGSTSNINLRVQIRNASTQAVLKEWVIKDFWGLANYELSGGLTVKSGQKIQISFRAYDAASGNHVASKQVYVSYSYRLK